MKAYSKPLTIVIILFFVVACAKEAQYAEGGYQGRATLPDNLTAKNMSINLKSATNPVSGTYVFDNQEGDISGTALGLIYTLKLTPKTAGGVVYNADVTWDGNKSITGTMKGVEAGKTVTYNLVLSK